MFRFRPTSLTILTVAVLSLIIIIIGSTPSKAKASLPGGEKANPNIIFIVVDALRADHVSSYGYERQTTPNLDAWMAAKGVLFIDTTTASSWTNPSNGAMLTSQLPSNINTIWANTSSRVPDNEKLLAEYLHDAGYRTAGFVDNWWMWPEHGYGQGFDYYVHTEGANQNRANGINDLAQNWLDANLAAVQSSGQPLYLYLYYMDPHTWYDPPSPYDTLYDKTYTGSLTPEVYAHGRDVVSGAITPSQRDIEHLIALYDGEITYWDLYLGKMFDYLKGVGLLENSIILVTSDHGQMFGEHGEWVHRNSLYEEVIRVPLIIRYPGVLNEGQVLETPVETMDIMPTILDLIGQKVPNNVEGISLLPLMRGEAKDASRPIYSEMAGENDPNSQGYWIAPRTNLYAVKQDGWKYIHAQQSFGQDELFQVKPNSIYEQENLIKMQQGRADALFKNLRDQFGIPTEYLFLPSIQRP